ncbi:MAG: serine/threonine-protein phosphatase, partial [Acidobacteriaceae bacterium]|nr:serine/threonine-protein phosphatase [Acidobacteriaceae bacterium]
AGLLWLGHSKKPTMLEASGTPIGLLPLVMYAAETFELRDGARLLAYTDGLTEVFQGEEEFGVERLAETFRSCTSRDCDGILDHIWNTLEAFTTEPEQRDDMTALIVLRQ